jgi:sugar (pentulose or hexulose) kinase
MRLLAAEGIGLDRMFAHGGMFRTAGVAQRFLAAAFDAPVSVAETASEGGAWGIAVLAAYLLTGEASARGVQGQEDDAELGAWLSERVFSSFAVEAENPDHDDVAGFAAYLERYRAGLAVERAAAHAIPLREAIPLVDATALKGAIA